MIIQCRQCRTKYTFDDALMQGDGVWMRCRRCQHVFFWDNPLTVKQPIEASINKASAFAQDALPAQRNGEISYEEMLTSGKDELPLSVIEGCFVKYIDNIASKTADSLIEPETHDILNFT